ncbi:unnamed protein product [Pleuronectes platessa]|uniref:Uncharacterized protein n=1 Tax=Pleuronectes platessa TaxID=8262 RepID=A0A9N7YJ23_PLEPL|nr:unnamed protein product [Pleuronectes platessa]
MPVEHLSIKISLQNIENMRIMKEARAAAGGAVAPSPSSPRAEAQWAAPGGPNPVAPNGVTGGGAFFLLDGPLEGTAVGGGDSGHVSGPSRGSPQLRRPPGEPSGWRLAAD